jgi:hypothetical protein
MYIRILSFIALLCVILIPSLEGRSHSSTRHHAQAIKRKPQPINHLKQKKQRQVERKKATRAVTTKQLHSRRALATQKKQQKVAVAGKNQHRIISAKPKPQLKRAALQRKKTPILNKRTRRAAVSSRYQHQRKAALIQKKQSSQSTLKRTQPKTSLQQKKISVHKNNSRNKSDYLSLLPFHNRENAKAGGLDQLLDKDMKGQGQTIAVVELSGVWKALKDAINNKSGRLSPELKANYKSNFLTPIGGPGLHPEQMNDWIRDRGNTNHGSSVSSIVLDLSPQAKVLPVSTFLCRHTDQFYDTADALMDLSRRLDVSIINISSGYTRSTSYLKTERKADGTEIDLFKTIYNPKLKEAFKAVAKAGKVVVMAVGNDSKYIHIPRLRSTYEIMGREELIGHLLQELDPETRESIIIAGSCNPDTRKITSYSNKPGLLKNAQEAFLLAPGNHVTSYNDDIAVGTSYAAPYICAAIANLTSNRKISPRRAVQALKDTAERRPDVGTYGRGIIRADKALELLERAGGG